MAVIAIGFLAAGSLFLLNTPSQRTPSTLPPINSPLQVIPPAPKDNITGTITLPEYVKQYINEQPPYLKSPGNLIHLVNNPGARDVSFAELKSFVLLDNTDDGTYVPEIKMCGDFAEMLHNNAEQKGIRSAFVAIDFENESIGHALNVFRTTDRGLVYIDCTGKGFRDAYERRPSGKPDPCERDRVAYIEKGKEYGLIDINKVESLNYNFYVEYAQNWQKFDSMMDEYNNEAIAFNRTYANKTNLPMSEYSKYEAWKAQLEGKERILKELEKKLGNCFAKPLGIVKAVEIYW
jgi:hypothetical protein